MVKRIILLVVLGLLFIVMNGLTWAQEDLRVTNYVTDNTGLLSENVRADLNTELSQFDKSTGNQILVVFIKSLDSQDLVQLAEDYFRVNKPGQKGKDNGLIILVAQQERKIRIETGYGMETVISDAKAGTIIQDIIAPHFKDNDFDGGIIAGITAIITAINAGEQ